MKPQLSSSTAGYNGRNLHGQVVNELGRRVVGGVYPAGALLPNEEQLCQGLAVSRTALREIIAPAAAALQFYTAILKATNNPLLMPLAANISSALGTLLNITARHR